MVDVLNAIRPYRFCNTISITDQSVIIYNVNLLNASYFFQAVPRFPPPEKNGGNGHTPVKSSSPRSPRVSTGRMPPLPLPIHSSRPLSHFVGEGAGRRGSPFSGKRGDTGVGSGRKGGENIRAPTFLSRLLFRFIWLFCLISCLYPPGILSWVFHRVERGGRGNGAQAAVDEGYDAHFPGDAGGAGVSGLDTRPVRA